MAINTQLGDLVTMLRNEIGASISPAQGQNDLPAIKNIIQRNQEMLYDDYKWQHMIKNVDMPLYAGQQYYTFDPLINFNLIYGAWVNWSTAWEPLIYGIDPMMYNYNNPTVPGTRADPATRWNHYDTNSFEIWPVPAGNVTQTVRFRCTRNLRPLLGDSDQADIDDRLIVLFCASEMLARNKSADAAAKQQLAQQRYRALKGNQLKKPMVIMGGGVPVPVRPEWHIRVVGA